jgi:hypothetical protein
MKDLLEARVRDEVDEDETEHTTPIWGCSGGVEAGVEAAVHPM